MIIVYSIDFHFQKVIKLKKKWFGKEKPLVSDSQNPELIEAPLPHAVPPLEEEKSTEVENEQTKLSYSVPVATSVALAEAAVEVAPVTTVSRFTGKSKEEVAAIRIQTVFRGFLVSLKKMYPPVSLG